MRRSKRARNVQSRDPAVEPSEADPSSEDEEVPKVKKRKVASVSTTKKVPKPRKAPARAKLRYITEVPLELLAEIFSYLEPRDLMHLSRANKGLRDILLNRSSLPIWKACVGNLGPKFPKCPDDVSIPRFVNFIFGEHCHFCSKKATRRSLHTGWQFLYKACENCFRERHSLYLNRRYDDIGSSQSYFPLVKVVQTKKRHNLYQWYMSHDIKKQLDEERAAAGDQGTWDEAQLLKLHRLTKIGDEFDKWKTVQEENGRAEAEALKKRIQASMLTRIQDSGWNNELARVTDMTSVWSALDWKKPIQYPLLDSDWDRSRPKLVVALEAIKRQRLAEETKTRLENALLAVQAARNKYGSTHYIVPLSGDLFQMEPIQNAIFTVFQKSGDDDVHIEAEKKRLQDAIAKAATVHLHSLTGEWIRERCQELLALLPVSSEPSSECPRDDMYSRLRLATTTFFHVDSCYESSRTPKTFVQVLTSDQVAFMGCSIWKPTNDRIEPPLLSTLATADKADRDKLLGYDLSWHASAYTKVTRVCGHNPDTTGATRPTGFAFFQTLVPVIEFILSKCGLDPQTATHGDLKNLRQVFRCGHKEAACQYAGLKTNSTSISDAKGMIDHWAMVHLPRTSQTFDVQSALAVPGVYAVLVDDPYIELSTF